MSEVEFKAWPKMTRVSPFKVVITEKMDGTNACVIIEGGAIVGVQSRKKLIDSENDNYGFAGWVGRNEGELLSLGDGHHYGEWVGLGIQKNPHDFPEKRFYLFNTGRWLDDSVRPDCCYVVRVIFEGDMGLDTISDELQNLKEHPPEGTSPEGMCVYYPAFDAYTKHTIKSPNGKWCKD